MSGIEEAPDCGRSDTENGKGQSVYLRDLCDRAANLVLAALLLGMAIPAYSQGTFKLTFEPANDQSPFFGWGDRSCDKLEKAPDTLKKRHEVLTEKAAYFLVDLDGRQLIAAIEPDPLTLVVDTDLDCDLSDETPMKHPDPSQPWRNFGTATIKGKVPITLAFACEMPADGSPPKLIVKPGGVYKGTVTLDGAQYTVMVGDITFDGRPNDPFDPEKPSDMFAMDHNGDGEFDLWDEIRPLPALTSQGKSFYDISVAPDGSSITFAPATPKTGSVKVTTPGAILSLFSAPGAYRVALRGEPMPLPVGRYDVYTIQICAWDDQDRRFRMQCIELPEKLRSFEIREGETATLEIGPPMKAKPVPVREGDKITVNVEVWGSYGERYFPYVRADQGGLAGWVGMKIIDERGNELSSGGFEYG
jgi:hypothetical protein